MVEKQLFEPLPHHKSELGEEKERGLGRTFRALPAKGKSTRLVEKGFKTQRTLGCPQCLGAVFVREME